MNFAESGEDGDGRNKDGKRHWGLGAPPRDATGQALTALAASILLIAVSWTALEQLRVALLKLHLNSVLVHGLVLLLGLAAGYPIIPAIRSVRFARQARLASAESDLIGSRVAAAQARDFAWLALGIDGAQLIAALMVLFLVANDMAVGRTFFLLPLIGSSFHLVLKAFLTNIYIFTIAEILVLVFGLAVAVARLAPGLPGRPIRWIAILYIDVFRALPAIINVYLIGFGISLTGLPVLKDLSPEIFAIFALTLTSSAYVAEVYRAGIESVHWSQAAAARSLGLSYAQALRFVIVPQAVRRIIPPLLNNFIGLQKDTALVNIVGVLDAFNQAKIIATDYFNLSAVTTVAILFVMITIPQARLVDSMIERDRQRTRADGN
jgi:polar amino acid transport system permease protein